MQNMKKWGEPSRLLHSAQLLQSFFSISVHVVSTVDYSTLCSWLGQSTVLIVEFTEELLQLTALDFS